MNLVLACILAYVVSQLVVAAWFARRVRSETDYLLADRSLGSPCAKRLACTPARAACVAG